MIINPLVLPFIVYANQRGTVAAVQLSLTSRSEEELVQITIVRLLNGNIRLFFVQLQCFILDRPLQKL